MMCCRWPRGPIVVALIACAGLVWGGLAAAQVPKEWRLLESDARTLDFRNKLREGTFDATSRSFLTDVALPQLVLPANRDTIDRVRRRIRELLVADASLPTIVDYAAALAKDETAAPVVRVNAMLLLGEVTGKDKKPWPAAAPVLVAAVGDATLPMAVRVAALAGLADHLAAAGPQLAATAGPVLLEVARADPTKADPVAVNWLAGRALTLLGRMGPETPAETVAVAAAVLADEDRPLDVRVRAAAALGGSAAEGRTGDMAASFRGIRDLAITVVQEERDRVQRMAPLANMASTGGAYGAPALGGFFDPTLSAEAQMMGPSPINESLQLAFRRAAWRLATLADALEAEGGGGLVAVAGPLAGTAGTMAKGLRTAATVIDGAPTHASIERAFKAIGGSGPPAPAVAAGGAAPGALAESSAGGAAATAPAARPGAKAAPQPAADGNPFAQ
jgi:hypothetical protein